MMEAIEALEALEEEAAAAVAAAAEAERPPPEAAEPREPEPRAEAVEPKEEEAEEEADGDGRLLEPKAEGPEGECKQEQGEEQQQEGQGEEQGEVVTPKVEPAPPPKVALEVCRVCAQPGVLISLFDNEETLRMCEKVAACAAVQIARDDGMPDRICRPCAADLEVAYAFKQRCEASDAQLREKLGLKARTIVKTEFVLIDCDDGGVNGDNDDSSSRRRRRRKRKKRRGDDDFVCDDDEDEDEDGTPPLGDDSDNDYRGYKEGKKRKKKKRRALTEYKSDSDDDVILVPPKKRKNASGGGSSPGGRYPCLHCDKSFPYPSVLKLHMVTHTKEKSHKCIVCGEAFTYSKSLYAHYKDAHPFENAPKAGASGDDGGGQRSFPCSMCDKVFGQAKNLKVHEAMHAREKKYRCEGCSQGFTNMSILQIHKKQHHPNMFRVLSCARCNRQFRRQGALDRHMENHRAESGGGSHDAKKPPLMKDLFKSIAPLTTTYWSDSFSD